MSEQDVDELLGMFKPLGDAQRAARQVRAKKERRTQLTPKQRKKGGVRTTQINYRCSPAYRELMAKLAEHYSLERNTTVSIADMAEEAASMLAEAAGIEVAT